MCYQCALEAGRQGKIVMYEELTRKRCKKHSGYELWKVKVSDELEEVMKRLTFLDVVNSFYSFYIILIKVWFGSLFYGDFSRRTLGRS